MGVRLLAFTAAAGASDAVLARLDALIGMARSRAMLASSCAPWKHRLQCAFTHATHASSAAEQRSPMTRHEEGVVSGGRTHLLEAVRRHGQAVRTTAGGSGGFAAEQGPEPRRARGCLTHHITRGKVAPATF